MRKTKIIGLTGGIASGKSSVANFLRDLNLPVFDADKAAHELIHYGLPAWEDIVKSFGREVLDTNKEIDRKKLGEIVFAEQDKLKVLETILHTRIWQAFEEFLLEQEKQHCQVVFLDAALLIEAGWHKKVDSVWLIYLAREEQIRRAMKRDKVSATIVQQRLDKQMTFATKKLLADKIIDNSFALTETYAQVISLVKELQTTE